MLLLTKQFTKWVILSNLFAWPIVYSFMHKWLQRFAFQPEISICSLLLASHCVFLIDLLTVSYPTVKAARSNFLAVVMQTGVNPIHFGIIMVLNLSIGLCTPPVGSVLFIGCGIVGTSISRVIRPLLPLFITMLVSLLLVTFISEISLFLPSFFGY